MSIYIKHIRLLRNRSELNALPDRKLVISTINAHSYNLAQKDGLFARALTRSDVLIPDGASIVKAIQWLKKIKLERIAGWDLFTFEMEKLNRKGGVCFFLGSSIKVLELIMKKTATDYTKIKMIGYSPRYKSDFTNEENKAMIDEIHAANPDLILIGMTAPKQEKWVYLHRNLLRVNCHICAIGAVFDFYAGTIRRAPMLWQKHSLEWLYRLIMEPRRMWKRYIFGNCLFIYYIFKEKFFIKTLLPEPIKPNKPETVEIHEQDIYTTNETHPHLQEQVQKKTCVFRLLLILISVAAGIGGFFLYPVLYPKVYKMRSPNNTIVTNIEDTNPIQSVETKKDTLILQTLIDTTDLKNNLQPEVIPSTPEIKSQSEVAFQSQRNFGQGKYVLIIGSFYTQPEAERHVKKVKAAGIDCEIINIGNQLFRISIAGFDNINEAERYAKQIKSKPYCKNVWVAKR